MKAPTAIFMSFTTILAYGQALAADKNGVSPQTISLPSGPGSISGLGESFQPQLNSGSGSYSVPIQLPKGPTGFAPSLALQYHTGNGNGILGLGWKLSGLTMVSRNMDRGLPLYVEAANGIDDDFDGVVDNPEEIDRYSGVDLEELVPLPDSTFRSENEGTFLRYERTIFGWVAREKNGTLHEFGAIASAQIEKTGRVFAWLRDRTTDLNGNRIEYRYVSDPGSPGQKYCKEIRWTGAPAFYAAVMSYDETRPDVHSDFRSGFEVRTTLRLSRIDVISQGVPASPSALTGDFNADGLPDALVRRYVLEYESDTLQSLLTRVTLVGSDGVTSLPPLAFAYTEWVPPNNVTSSFVRSSGDPVAALDSPDVELIDMNNDGLPDLLQATTTAHRVHLNLGMNASGRLAWDTVGITVANAPNNVSLGSPTVHLADHTADGDADLIHKVNSTTFECFVNSGQDRWLNAVSLHNTDSWPRWPFENAGSRTLDTDHNRMNDILFTSDNSYRLWMLMPGGRYGREVSLPVLSDGTRAFSFEDPGARIADVNGDRISDLAWIQSTRVVYWASCGRGNFEGPSILLFPPSGSLSADEIARSEFADINGDGLADLVVIRPAVSPNGIHYRLNSGRAGFGGLRTIVGLPAVVCTGTPPNLVCDAQRWADMNGNGSVDFLISNRARDAGTREQFLDFVPGIRPHLLRRIDNGLGLVTTMDYETSVQQMVRARTAGQPWTSTMPISVPVVALMTEDDSRGNQTIREFTYRDPRFDAQKQEFRGFSKTEAKDIGDASVPTKITRYEFDTGLLADCRKGKVLAEEVTDALGALFDRVQNTVQHRLLGGLPGGRQVCFAFDETKEVDIFEQTNNPVHLRTDYEYDDFGNILTENKHGVANQAGDEVFVEKQYAYRPDIWLMDRMTRSTTRDGNGSLAGDSLFSYDARGNMVEQRNWLDTGNRHVLAIHSDYDSFGNVVHMVDANGHGRSVAYDSLVHAYPVSETVHLQSHDLVTTAAYDMEFGTVTSSVDFAGAQTNAQYDALGRPTAILRPEGAETRYTYELGAPISRVITQVREELGGGTFDSYAYSDGLGRNLGFKIEAEDGQWRFVDAIAFNNRKLQKTNWLPYFTTTNEYEIPDTNRPHRDLAYDAQGRNIQTTNPDGTQTRNSFEPFIQQQFDENDTAGANTPKTTRKDGLGRTVEVVERNGPDEYHTVYAWNTLGDLLRVTDAQANQKTMIYDSLKRNISLNDPDRGIMTYEYDDVGNLLRMTDANNQQIFFSYDFANRLVTENYLDQGGGPADPIDVSFLYDLPSQNVPLGDGTFATATFTGGRLASVADLSGEEHQSYDARGNVIRTVKRIRDPLLGLLTSYTTGFDYDAMNRIKAVHYPDGDRCLYSYNSASFVESMGGGPGGQLILAGATYEPTGHLASLTYGNGAVTAYTYDDRDRLAGVRTASVSAGDLINYSYAYDPVSNIIRIDDLRPLVGPRAVPVDSTRRNTQLFAYDDLYRITQVKYSPAGDAVPTHGQIDYTYDRIGNMVSQINPPVGQAGHISDPRVGLGTMTTGGPSGTENRHGRAAGASPGPHALTATQAGGTYEYDDNGNMIGLEGAVLTWDFKDRLTRFQKNGIDAQYIYDYGGRRVAKLVKHGKTKEETLYVNPNFEYRPGLAPIKYVFNGGTRIAQIKGTLDTTQDRLQRIWLFEGWNLLTVAVETSQTTQELFGQGSKAYEWTGAEYLAISGNAVVPVGKALWVEVPNARLATASGPYAPADEPIAIPAGQNLVAWPRLEPFVPAQHLSSNTLRIHAHDPQQLHWLLNDPSLPANVADVIGSFSATSAFWFTAPAETTLVPAATASRDTIFYHGDHLGSSNVMTNKNGTLVQEVAYYPFGEVRNSHAPGQLSRDPYGFTQKEQDQESDLHYFEARFMAGGLGRFLSPDPKFANPAMLSAEDLSSYLSQPQKTNLYSYVLNNPIKYNDPTGLDESKSVPAQLSEKTGDSSTLASLFATGLEVIGDANTRLPRSELSTGLRDVSSGAKLTNAGRFAGGIGNALQTASLVCEAVDFAQDPTTDKAVHLGGTGVITVGGFISGPGAAIAGGARYMYENTPKIHDAANRVGDVATAMNGGNRAAGGIAAAEVSVGLSLMKLGMALGGGQAGVTTFDMGLEYLLGGD